MEKNDVGSTTATGGITGAKPETLQHLIAHIDDWRKVEHKYLDLKRLGAKASNQWDQNIPHWDIAMSSLQKCIEEIRRAGEKKHGTESG